MNSQKHPTKLT